LTAPLAQSDPSAHSVPFGSVQCCAAVVANFAGEDVALGGYTQHAWLGNCTLVSQKLRELLIPWEIDIYQYLYSNKQNFLMSNKIS